jgi:hypothetical protein
VVALRARASIGVFVAGSRFIIPSRTRHSIG